MPREITLKNTLINLIHNVTQTNNIVSSTSITILENKLYYKLLTIDEIYLTSYDPQFSRIIQESLQQQNHVF